MVKQSNTAIDTMHLERVEFLHSVGVSTLKYGITIPIETQSSQMLSIDKGDKVPIQIFFGNTTPVVAELRRLNNRVGHLQIRYENKAQERLRSYLKSVFTGRISENLLEVEEIGPLAFSFRPILEKSIPHLRINDVQVHRMEREAIEQLEEVNDIQETMTSIKYDVKFNQSDYNKRITQDFVKRGWNREEKVIGDLGLRCDFEKKGIWVEVEFGNARSYYQDYVKFILAKNIAMRALEF